MKYLLTLSYLGTAYCGWQVQRNAVSVQSRLQDAVQAVLGKRYPVTGCSRTDSGVHADGFCCTIETDNAAPSISPASLPFALNCALPHDIAVQSAREVPHDFHPRYDAVRKIYRYLIWNAPCRSPLYHGRAWHCPRHLDAETMCRAAQPLIGQHDFAAFCAAGSSVTDTVRTLYALRVERQDDLITVTAEGNGFLYKMVRILCGTLADAALGRLDPDGIADILQSRDRGRAGQTLPPEGLYLHRVVY